MRKTRYSSSKFIFVLLLLLFFIGLFVSGILQSEQRREAAFPKSGFVTAVYDGDTIKVRFNSGYERKVRLIGINAPETHDLRKEVKFHAYMAKRFAFYYLYNRKVNLTYDWELEDKYGRLLAYIWTEREGLFNEFILKEGFASVFLKFAFKYKKEFKKAEEEAQRLGRGFWKKGPFPSIRADEARNNIGKLVSVKYTCSGVQNRGKFVFLVSSGEEFSALIPQENLSLFSGLELLRGNFVSVTGFLEEYKDKPQIMVFFPIQIKLIRRKP